MTFVTSPTMGYGSAVKVEEGIYFVNGFFVRNDAGLVLVSGYTQTPSIKVGFNVSESVVTPEKDSSLYDNAAGSSNFASPGAHRLQIQLELVKYEYNQTPDKNFIQLLSIKNGVVERQVRKVDYSLIEETLARRTYDESGDYIVDNFDAEIREYYQQDGILRIQAGGVDGNVKNCPCVMDNIWLLFNISKILVLLDLQKMYYNTITYEVGVIKTRIHFEAFLYPLGGITECQYCLTSPKYTCRSD